MIARIKAMFDKGTGTGAAPREPDALERKHLAAAVLMVEAARLDQTFDERERATVLDLVERHFGASEDEALALVAVAESTQDEANELVRFTRVIKETFSASERVELIEMLWEVAYADGVLHDYEANLLRRVAGLIYVSDRDRGAARKRVLERLGMADAPAPA